MYVTKQYVYINFQECTSDINLLIVSTWHTWVFIVKPFWSTRMGFLLDEMKPEVFSSN